MKTRAFSPVYVVFSIKEGSSLLRNYLYSILKSDKLDQFILQLAQRVVLQQLRFNDLKKIKIPLPPLDAQKQIVERIEAESVGGICQKID